MLLFRVQPIIFTICEAFKVYITYDCPMNSNQTIGIEDSYHF